MEDGSLSRKRPSYSIRVTPLKPDEKRECRIQLFKITLSDQSKKLKDKTAGLCGIFGINLSKPAMPRPYS